MGKIRKWQHFLILQRYRKWKMASAGTNPVMAIWAGAGEEQTNERTIRLNCVTACSLKKIEWHSQGHRSKIEWNQLNGTGVTILISPRDSKWPTVFHGTPFIHPIPPLPRRWSMICLFAIAFCEGNSMNDDWLWFPSAQSLSSPARAVIHSIGNKDRRWRRGAKERHGRAFC